MDFRACHAETKEEVLSDLPAFEDYDYPNIAFKNFTKESKSLMCNVFQCEDGGVLIYVPSIYITDVFTKLEAAD